jgi:hypothetical protein
MIKFEADPVVGYKQREARSDGEKILSPSNIVAPKSPPTLVFFFALLTL